MLDQKNQKGEAKIRRKTILQRIQDVKKHTKKKNKNCRQNRIVKDTKRTHEKGNRIIFKSS